MLAAANNQDALDAVIRAQVSKELDRVRNCNDLEILGLGVHPSPNDVEAALDKQRRNLSPSALVGVSDVTRALAQSLLDLLEAAAGRLRAPQPTSTPRPPSATSQLVQSAPAATMTPPAAFMPGPQTATMPGFGMSGSPFGPGFGAAEPAGDPNQWMARAQAAEQKLAEIQYHGLQLVQQLKMQTTRAETAEKRATAAETLALKLQARLRELTP